MAVRVAVAGMGLMGRLHAEVYRAHPDAELVAVVEADATRHDELRSTFDVPVHGDLAPALDGVDAVSVCTPDHVRTDVLLPAFARGVRVLVEKPLATSLAEGRKLLAACPTPDALMVGQLLRFDPRVQQARDVVTSGELGDVWSVRCWRNNSTAVADRIAPRTSVDWFLGIHDVDMVRYVTGHEVVDLQARAISPYSTNRDLVRGTLTLTDGVAVDFSWSWLLPPARCSGLQADLEVVGSAGMLEVDLSHNAVALTTSSSGRQAQLDTYHWPPQRGVPAGDLREEIGCFLAGGEPPVTGADGLRAVAVVEAVERAATTGNTSEVEPV